MKILGTPLGQVMADFDQTDFDQPFWQPSLAKPSTVEALRLTMRASGALLDGAMIHFLVEGQPATVDFQQFAVFVQLLLVISFTVCQIVPCSRTCVRSGASDVAPSPARHLDEDGHISGLEEVRDGRDSQVPRGSRK